MAMTTRAAVAICWLGFAAYASSQEAAPPAQEPCVSQERIDADRPVDDYIAEINQQKRRRNKNPLPEYICIWGWCRQVRSGSETEAPPKVPAPQPPPAGATVEPGPDSATLERPRSGGDGHSSSRQPACISGYDPIRAAEHVEIGDHYFGRKNYRGALSRYQEALENKPADPAIHLRLGRTLEKMDDFAQAYAHYQLSARSVQDGPWKKEAQKALARLRPQADDSPAAPKL